MASMFDSFGQSVGGYGQGLASLFGSIGQDDWKNNLQVRQDENSGEVTQFLNPSFLQGIQGQGYDIQQRGDVGEGQDNYLDLYQNGSLLNSFFNQAKHSGLDNAMFSGAAPLLVLGAGMLAGGAAGAGAGGAGAGTGSASGFLGEGVASGIGGWDAAAGMGLGGGGAGGIGAAGSAGSLVPGIQSGLINPAIGESVGAMGAGGGSGGMTGVGVTNAIGNVAPMATPAPWAGGMATPNAIGGAGGAMASGGAPGFTLGQLSSGAAIGGAALEQPMSAANYSDAAAGYGESMSGADTGFFDSMLGLTGSPGFANTATQFASPIMNNPMFDELRKLRELMGKPVAGKLTGGDLLKGAMSLNNYRQNSKNLKNQQNSLAGMFGQNSPYAQQLKQQLERRDAAAGRRSQYGPREVELQAQLAKMAAGVAPSINQISQQRQQQRGALTNTAGMLLDKGLGSMFGG